MAWIEFDVSPEPGPTDPRRGLVRHGLRLAADLIARDLIVGER